MKLKVEPGKYVVAVSGGVDSIVLLDLLSKLPKLDLIVAHFDHGIRPHSNLDAQFVAKLAAHYKLPFKLGQGRLGAGASEELARSARYEFLEKIKETHKAQAIITAHHQDDLIETAFINLVRGTGRRGLIALAARKDLERPLLDVPKREILAYAKAQNLSWREDETNLDTNYLRNYLRHKILNKLSIIQRREILKNIHKLSKNSKNLDPLLADLAGLVSDRKRIDRQLFTSLPSGLAAELLASIFTEQKIGEFDKKTIERANTAIRTAKPGSQVDLVGNNHLKLTKELAWIEPGN